MIFNMAGEAAPVENSGMQLTQATRHARRIYVGGLPPSANEDRISNFFSYALAAVGGATSYWAFVSDVLRTHHTLSGRVTAMSHAWRWLVLGVLHMCVNVLSHALEVLTCYAMYVCHD